MRLNLIGDSGKIEQLVDYYAGAKLDEGAVVIDRFTDGDVNVEVGEEDLDQFTDDCEVEGITWKVV